MLLLVVYVCPGIIEKRLRRCVLHPLEDVYTNPGYELWLLCREVPVQTTCFVAQRGRIPLGVRNVIGIA